MLCPNCHFNNQDGAQFCSRCGTHLTAAPQAWPQASGEKGQGEFQGRPFDQPTGGPEVTPPRSAYAPPEGGNFYRSLEDQDQAYGRPAGSAAGQPPQQQNPYADYRPGQPYNQPPVNRPYRPDDRAQAPPYETGYTDDFAGDRYGGADAYYEEPTYDNGYYNYDAYPQPQPRKGRTGQIILTVALAVVALAVVVGIIFVVRNLLSDPPLQQSATASSELAKPTGSPSVTGRPSQMSLPSAKPSYTAPSTTAPSTTPSTTPSLSAPSEAAAGSVKVHTDYVIRSGPGTSYSRIGLLSNGGTIKVIGEVEGEAVSGIGSSWYVVEYNGQTAYMIKDPSAQTRQAN